MAEIETLGLRLDASGMVTGGQQSERALQGVSTAAEQTERRVLSLAGVVRAGADTIGASARSIGNDLLHLGAGFIGAFAGLQGIEKFIHETSEAQYATAQLEAAVTSTGGAAQRSVAQLEELSAALQHTTIYSDEAVDHAEALLLTFDKIKGTQFDEATKAVADLATRMGGDLQGAALQLGKALQDPEQGLQALRRSGVSFSASQQGLIKDMFETGKVAEAQTLILRELEKEFGGSAAAARNTLGGSLQGLKNDFGELFEASKGGTSGIVDGIKAIDSALVTIKPHMGEIVKAAEALGVVFGLKAIASGLTALSQWSQALIVARAETLAYAEANALAARSQVLQAESAAASAAQAAALARANAAVSTSVTARIAATTELTAANVRLAASEEAVVIATAAETEAVAALSLGARTAAGALGILNSALAFVGGPVGAAVIAAFLAVRYAFDKQGEGARQAKTDLDAYAQSLAGMTAEQIKAEEATTRGLLAQTEARRAALASQESGLPKAGTPGYDVNTTPQLSNSLSSQISGLTSQIDVFNAHLTATHGLLVATGNDSVTLAGKAKELITERQAELDKLVALNGAYGQSDLAIKQLEIAHDGLIKTLKDEKDLKALGLDPAEYAAAKKAIDGINAALTHQQEIQAKNAVLKAQAIDVAAYTAANAALVQATANETTLAEATNRASLAQQQGAASVAHLWAAVAVGSSVTSDVVAATRNAVAADVAAEAATRDRTAAIERLKIAQEAQAASTAAYVTFQKEAKDAVNATSTFELNAAAAKFAADGRAILQQRFLKDAAVTTTQAFQAQAAVVQRSAADTAFSDSLNAQIAATDRETAALLEEAAASAQGQAALDALHVKRAADAAAIALETAAQQKQIALTQDQRDAVRASAAEHEKAAIAVAKLAEQQKLLSQPLENFIRNTQSDVAGFFTDIFSNAGTATQKFWSSFRDLALKTLGEIAAVNLEQKLLGKATGIGGAPAIPQTRSTGTYGQLSNESDAALGIGSPAGGAQDIGKQSGISAADQQRLGYFALAAAGVALVADAMNRLTGVSHQTAEGLDAQIRTAISFAKSLADFNLEINGSAIDKAIQAAKDRAQSLRDEADAAFPGKKLEAEREKQIAEINRIDAIRIKQIQDEFDAKQKESQQDYAVRALRATGLGAEADALAFAEQQQREYAAAVKDGATTLSLLALATAQKAEADKRARDIQEQQENRARDLGVRSLAATGGTDRQVDDLRFTIGQERELAELRKVGTQAEIDALVAVQEAEAQQRAADFAALQQRTREDYAVRQLQAEGHSAEAAALRLQLDQQREYQDAVKAGLDDATLAALALAQAAEGAAAAAKQAQDAQRALDDLQVRALTAKGDTSGADQLRFQLQQQREIEDAIAAGRSQEYIDKLKDVQALEAKARADAAAAALSGSTVNNTAAGSLAQPSGETTAIANAAHVLTEVTGNRMADYLASILIVERQQLDVLKTGISGGTVSHIVNTTNAINTIGDTTSLTTITNAVNNAVTNAVNTAVTNAVSYAINNALTNNALTNNTLTNNTLTNNALTNNVNNVNNVINGAPSSTVPSRSMPGLGDQQTLGMFSALLAIEREQLNFWKSLGGLPAGLTPPRGGPTFDRIDTTSLDRWTGNGQARTSPAQRPSITITGPLVTIQVTQQPGEDERSLIDRIIDEAGPRLAEIVNEQLAIIAAQEAQRDGNPLVTGR